MRSKIVVLLSLLFVSSVCGQVTTATLYGIVTDSSRAVVPGATVSLTNEETGAVHRKVSDSVGEFGFDFIPSGTYTLRIESKGFKSFESKGLTLTAGQQARQTFALDVGSLNETVSVEATATLLNSVSAEQQQSITGLEVSQLPLARRNVSNILPVGTGVSNAGGAVRMNGFGRMGTAYSVDGTNASGSSEGRSASTYGASNYVDIMSIEGISEVQTITENVRLQFRADMFNALNHTVLSGLVTEITNPRFGQLTSTNGARVMQLNARLSW